MSPRETSSPDSCRRFRCRDLIEHDQGRGSLGKICQLTALVVSTFGFIWLTVTEAMTEFYFMGYMIAWSGANVANKLVDYKRPSREVYSRTSTRSRTSRFDRSNPDLSDPSNIDRDGDGFIAETTIKRDI